MDFNSNKLYYVLSNLFHSYNEFFDTYFQIKDRYAFFHCSLILHLIFKTSGILHFHDLMVELIIISNLSILKLKFLHVFNMIVAYDVNEQITTYFFNWF